MPTDNHLSAANSEDKRRRAVGAQRHKLDDRGLDLYETPPVAVRALLRVEYVPAVIWEPACGPGSIVRTLRATGRTVIATDLARYRSTDQDSAGRDFLVQKKVPPGVEAIVTNPPYAFAAEFVRKALALCPLVMMLLRLAFLESERRMDILDGGSLARVHIFRRRLPMMHRDGWEGPRASSSIAFGWFVWHHGHEGPATINRITWKGR